VPALFGGTRDYGLTVPMYRRSVILRTTNIVNRTVKCMGRGWRLIRNPAAFVARERRAGLTLPRAPRAPASTQGVSGGASETDELRGPKGLLVPEDRGDERPPPRLPPGFHSADDNRPA
jgi:hypothetical protein